MVLSSDAPRLATPISTPSSDVRSPAASLLLAVVGPSAAALAARLTRVALPAGRRRAGRRPADVAGGLASAEQR
jgi:hypothetical protein